ncbi:Carbohydrate binding module (family 6) [Synechococcus sp. PCC 7335]|uniref:malectin domain-containing carbohydrate-binding protein n=1 Tax=Synechococcus sp. (strain ATCC 29403 / PCC 7335) TaxID=91464 RepID=UPI00017EDD26|nr:malectin domain-containing carbohydrate-binding protein [Synechococcus sp. PCC 7335]EDX86073.1 Carbohydrate binding module (family 6) [Synechococcus sp. PCC 7335]
MIDAFSGITPVDSIDPNQTGSAKISILPDSGIQKSSFGTQSFTVENTGSKRIAAIYFDVTEALYLDTVFDPVGLAGDSASRGLEYSSTGNTGAIEPSAGDKLAPFYGTGGSSGYKGMLLTFDANIDGGYSSGEIIKFGVDMDSNSIIGLPKDPVDINGADPRIASWDIGGVSGAELINSKVHILFTDGTTAVGELASDGSQGGSVAVASQVALDKQVSLTVNGVTEGGSGLYSQSNIQVLVSGQAGDTVRVVLSKGFIQPFEYTDPDGNVIDLSNQFVGSPFPANNAVQFQTVDVLLDGTSQDITSLFDFGAPNGIPAFPGDSELPISFVANAVDSSELPAGPVTEPIYLLHDATLPVIDTTAPTASLQTTSLILPIDGSDAAQFVIEYSDNAAVDVSTLDSQDLVVTGPNGAQTLSFVSADVNSNGAIRQATYELAAPAGGWQNADAGSYSVSLAANEVADTSGNVAAAGSIGSFNITVSEPPTLGNGPLRIEAEDYKAGTNGVEYFDTTAGNGGGEYRSDDVDIAVTGDVEGDFNIGIIAAGEYLTYDVNIATAGTYEITLRLASGRSKDRDVDVSIGGQTFTITVPTTGSWGTYQDFTITDVDLAAGLQEIKVAFPDGKLNFNYFDITQKGVAAPDDTAPTAALQTPTLIVPAQSSDDALFVVEYADNVAVDIDSLGAQDLSVVGPFGVQAVTFVSADVNSDGAVRQATYSIAAPTGGWETTDSGSYTIAVVAGEVVDTSGNAVAAGSLGDITLSVEEPTPDTTAPTASLQTTSLILPIDGSDAAQFVIEYSDNAAVDVSTLDSQDLVVTGPNGAQTLSFVSADVNSNGAIRQATYELAAPAGGWQNADAGSYSVSLAANEVADTSGNSVAAGAIGSFEVTVGQPSQPEALRINAGGGNYIDTLGNQWVAGGDYLTKGKTTDTIAPIFKTEDDTIYQTAAVSRKKNAPANFVIPVDNGNYALNLHFAEIVHDDFGQRLFDIILEGETVLSDLDIFEKSKNAFFPGKDSALVLNFQDIDVSDGALNLTVESTVDKSIISGIEVIPIVGPQVILRQSDRETNVAEAGNNDTYEIVLNTQPTADVVIQIQSDTQQLVTDQTTLTFTPANWNTAQTVLVTAVDDELKEGTETYQIAHTVSSQDSNYNNLAVSDVSTTISDNDVPIIGFTQKTVANPVLPTRGTWGPDGRLYVGTYLGEINAYTFDDDYNVIDTQVINTLTGLDNPNILGIAFNPFSTATNPEIYVAHSQLYANGGSSFPETELSPYSGQVSILSGPNFSTLTPLITGLPVSNHDHGVNGLEFDDQGDLLIAIGGNTNAGVPNDNIGGIPESPFAAAIIKAEITKPGFNGAVEYVLPPDFVPPAGLTFDPEDSQTWGEIVDVAPGVDVSLYGAGLRNPFDLVWTTQGKLYATDNGANAGLGNVSTSATTEAPFTEDVPDELNLVVEGGYYGHPNRNLGRYDNRFNQYYSYLDESIPGVYNAPLAFTPASTNGLEEYRATTFEGQLKGDLLAQQWNNELHRYKLSEDGLSVVQQEAFTGITDALDIVTGPGGAIVGVDLSDNSITVSLPDDLTVRGLQAYDIFPWRAPAIGGKEFVVGGTGFGDISDTTVTFGSTSAQLTYVSDNRIKGLFPALTPTGNLLDITVASAGDVSTIEDAFLAV